VYRGYVMESPREAQRLADKVDAHAWVRRHLAPHVTAEMRVLDVGCGPATIAAEVARLVPHGAVVGLDASAARIAVARETLASSPNAAVVRGDAADLPFDDESFDLVYCRFLLEYLPDKQRAVGELARVCRAGGTVLLQDLDGQLVGHYPPDEELQRQLARALELLATTGFDPYVGSKLRFLLDGAGLGTARQEVEPYHLIVGVVDPEERALWQVKLEIAAAALTELGFEDADAVAEHFLAYLDRADTRTISHLFTAWALKQ
jgi:SAM-dependent methyltransferase